MKRRTRNEEARRIAQRRWVVEEHRRLRNRAVEIEQMLILLRKDAERFGLVDLFDELERDE